MRWANLKVWIYFHSHIRALAFWNFWIGSLKSAICSGNGIWSALCSGSGIWRALYRAQETFQWFPSVLTSTNQIPFCKTFRLCVSIFLFPFFKYKTPFPCYFFIFQEMMKMPFAMSSNLATSFIVYSAYPFFGFQLIVFVLDHRYIDTWWYGCATL